MGRSTFPWKRYCYYCLRSSLLHPSRCAVADSCSVSLDRRMTAGETWESCLDEIRALPSVKKYGDDVKVSMYELFPSFLDRAVYILLNATSPPGRFPKDHKVTKALEDAYTGLYGDERQGNRRNIPRLSEMRQSRPLTDKWTFSTNGVSIMGRNGIPCIGFGTGCRGSGSCSQREEPGKRTW